MPERFNMEKGKLIVVEGACDGIGKTTQYDLLRERLNKDGYVITTHHFPSYDTDQGKLVEMYLKGKLGKLEDLSPYFINGLYAIDRAVTWHTELKPRYDAGDIILLDRYTTSSLIYQAAFFEDLEEKKAFLDFVCDYEYNKLGIGIPDNIIFLHAPFDLVTEMRNRRKNNAGVENDIHESDIAYMKKVYDNSKFVADYLNWEFIESCNNGVFKSKQEIHQDIYKRIRKS